MIKPHLLKIHSALAFDIVSFRLVISRLDVPDQDLVLPIDLLDADKCGHLATNLSTLPNVEHLGVNNITGIRLTAIASDGDAQDIPIGEHVTHGAVLRTLKFVKRVPLKPPPILSPSQQIVQAKDQQQARDQQARDLAQKQAQEAANAQLDKEKALQQQGPTLGTPPESSKPVPTPASALPTGSPTP